MGERGPGPLTNLITEPNAMPQGTLTDEYETGDDSTDETGESGAVSDSSSSGRESFMAPPDRRGGDLCCPWCLGTKEDFEDVPMGVGCPHCGSLVPTEAEWYRSGEKIIV